jgi:hypothetical protein
LLAAQGLCSANSRVTDKKEFSRDRCDLIAA